MSEQIKKGDLVMIVKPTPCCGHSRAIGYVFVVDETSDGVFYCGQCKRPFDGRLAHPPKLDGGVPTTLLKKLNPPAEEESQVETKELEVV